MEGDLFESKNENKVFQYVSQNINTYVTLKTIFFILAFLGLTTLIVNGLSYYIFNNTTEAMFVILSIYSLLLSIISISSLFMIKCISFYFESITDTKKTFFLLTGISLLFLVFLSLLSGCLLCTVVIVGIFLSVWIAAFIWISIIRKFKYKKIQADEFKNTIITPLTETQFIISDEM